MAAVSLWGVKHEPEVRKASVFELRAPYWRRKHHVKSIRRKGGKKMPKARLARRGWEWFARCRCGWEGERRRGAGAWEACLAEATEHRLGR